MKTFSKTPQENTSLRISCPVCGDVPFNSAWQLKGFAFSRCTGCSLLYQNPQPLQSDLIERYDEEYFEYEIENQESFLQLNLLGLKDVGFFDDIQKNVFAGEASPRFLDVGCATGRLLEYLQQQGWEEQGVEVCEPAADYGRRVRGVSIFSGELEKAHLPEASFEIVHASHVIEHLQSPGDFISEAYRLLKPEGHLILITPNSDGFQAKLMRSRWRSAIADHMVLFSRKTLTLLLEKHGFYVEHSATWGGIPQGMAPAVIKKYADRIAKHFGWGDVMVLRARKKHG